MNQLRVAFYTEVGKKRGLGHLIRSYTIYEKFKKNCLNAHFFVDTNDDIEARFDDITYFKWSEFKAKSGYDLVFIDSYDADISVYQAISSCCKVAVFIDDYGRLDYPKGVILNFSPDAEGQFFKKKGSENHYLLGLDYIPIRKQFLDVIPVQQKQIFIMLGGYDTKNLTQIIVDILKDINMKKIVVINNNEVAKVLSKNKNIQVLYKPTDKDLIEAMSTSSLAISTASMSLYEIAFFKVPAVVIAVAKNQEIGAKQLIKNRLAKSFVSIKNKNWKYVLKKEVLDLCSKSELPVSSAIDGLGVQRIFNEMERLIKK